MKINITMRCYCLFSRYMNTYIILYVFARVSRTFSDNVTFSLTFVEVSLTDRPEVLEQCHLIY